jgi:hypothetical protein
MLTVKASMSHLQCIILAKIGVAKMLSQLKKVFFFLACERFSTLSRVPSAAHQAVTIKAGVCRVHV